MCMRYSCLFIASVLIGTQLFALADEQNDKALFQKVSAKLDMGGKVFGYLNVRNELLDLMGKADTFLRQSLATQGMEEQVPEDFQVEDVLLALGLHRVDALGYSSKRLEKGYLNKGFASIDRMRMGLIEAKPLFK